MMNEDEIRRISQFFFLSLLNERKALACVSKAIHKANLLIQNKMAATRDQAIVMATDQVLSSQLWQQEETFQTQFVSWRLPAGTNLTPWQSFLKTQRKEEVLCLLWYRALKISDQDIAEALKLSLGTVRFRLSRALKELGKISQETEAQRDL